MGLGGLCDFESLNLKWLEVNFSSPPTASPESFHSIKSVDLSFDWNQSSEWLSHFSCPFSQRHEEQGNRLFLLS